MEDYRELLFQAHERGIKVLNLFSKKQPDLNWENEKVRQEVYDQKLIALRKEKDIVVYGKFEPLCREDDQIFAYMRKLDEERLLTVCNFSEMSAEFDVPAEFEGSRCLLTNLGRKVFEGKIVLKPYEAFVLYK